MSRMETIGCFALTEPDAGSDATSLRTTATPCPGGFVLRGKKRWIGNAPFSNIMIVYARNSDTGTIGAYVVEIKSTENVLPRRPHTPEELPRGLTMTTIDRKVALRIVQNGDICFDNVFIPFENALPVQADFRRSAGLPEVLAHSRLLVAWLPVGVGMGVFDVVLRYLKERQQFGASLASLAISQEKLARMAGSICAGWALCERLTATFPCDLGPSKKCDAFSIGMPHVAMIKAWSTREGRAVVSLGRELLGGNGIIVDFHVAKAFADLEALYT